MNPSVAPPFLLLLLLVTSLPLLGCTNPDAPRAPHPHVARPCPSRIFRAHALPRPYVAALQLPQQPAAEAEAGGEEGGEGILAAGGEEQGTTWAFSAPGAFAAAAGAAHAPEPADPGRGVGTGTKRSSRSRRRLRTRRSPKPGHPDSQFSPHSVLKYWNGPVLTDTIGVNLVYYGNWGQRTATSDVGQGLLRSFVSSITGTQSTEAGSVAAWWGVNSLLTQSDGKHVSSQVIVRREVYDNYSLGKWLVNNEEDLIFQIIKQKLDTGELRPLQSDVYFVITSPDVHVGSAKSGFCGKTGYCGWHDTRTYKSNTTRQSTPLYFAFVGNPISQCPQVCIKAPNGTSPNGNPGMDAVVNIFAHELAEMATDPNTISGWLSSQWLFPQENADLCQNTTAPLISGHNPSFGNILYNLQGMFGIKFLVQALYNPVRAACTFSP